MRHQTCCMTRIILCYDYFQVTWAYFAAPAKRINDEDHELQLTSIFSLRDGKICGS